MTTEPRAPDQPAEPPAPEGGGLGPNPDPAAEEKRRAVEREVYLRRTQTDAHAEAEQISPVPLGRT